VRREFEYPLKEITEGKPLKRVKGVTYRVNGKIINNPERTPPNNLDSLPFVTRVYKQDLDIHSYHLPFTLHPYVSIYTGRGCPHKCSFCLWPQTFTGRKYRRRSIEDVIEEVKFVKNELPEVKEISLTMTLSLLTRSG